MINADSLEGIKLLPTGIDVARTINHTLEELAPHLIDLAPFCSSYDVTVGRIGALYIYRVEDTGGRWQSIVRSISEEETAFLGPLENQLSTASDEHLYQLLGRNWVSRNKFTYVGQIDQRNQLGTLMDPKLSE
jgi:hypothetical protein